MHISFKEVLIDLELFVLLNVCQICGGKVISMNERSTPLMFANSGLVAIKRLDVGWMAFVTVRNTGPSPLHVVGRMLDCCEVIGNDENDCTSMRLMGGSMGILQPSLYKNVTFLFSNMYPYNRRGECSVEIWYKDKANRTDSIKVTIPFDTYIRNGFIHPSMAVFGEFDKLLSPCESPDLDPLDNCRPVDCHMKYNGNKNFYSSVRKLCLPNPTCYSDPDKELPDVAYVPTCNECRDVETPISEDDLRSLLKPTAHCIHGENFPPPSIELKMFVIGAAALVSLILLLFVCCCVSGRETWDGDISGDESSDNDEDLQRDEGSTKHDGIRSLKAYFAQADYFSDTSDISNLEDIIEKANNTLCLGKDRALNSQSDNCSGDNSLSPDNCSKIMLRQFEFHNAKCRVSNTSKRNYPLNSNATDHLKKLKVGPFNYKIVDNKSGRKSIGRNVIVMGNSFSNTNHVSKYNNKKYKLNVLFKTLLKFIFHSYENIPSDTFNKKFLIMNRSGVPHKFRYALVKRLEEDLVFSKMQEKTCIQHTSPDTIILTKGCNENGPKNILNKTQSMFQYNDLSEIFPKNLQNTTSIKSMSESRFTNDCVRLTVLSNETSLCTKIMPLIPQNGILRFKDKEHAEIVKQSECRSNSVINIEPDFNLLLSGSRLVHTSEGTSNGVLLGVEKINPNPSVILDIEEFQPSKTENILHRYDKKLSSCESEQDFHVASKFQLNSDLSLPVVHFTASKSIINVTKNPNGEPDCNYVNSAMEYNLLINKDPVKENDNISNSHFGINNNHANYHSKTKICAKILSGTLNEEGYIPLLNGNGRIGHCISLTDSDKNISVYKNKDEQNNSDSCLKSDLTINTCNVLKRASNVKRENGVFNFDLSCNILHQRYWNPRTVKFNLLSPFYSREWSVLSNSKKDDTSTLVNAHCDTFLGKFYEFPDTIRTSNNINQSTPFLFKKVIDYDINFQDDPTLYRSLRNELQLLPADRRHINGASKIKHIFYFHSENSYLSDISELCLCEKELKPLYALNSNFLDKNYTKKLLNSFYNKTDVRNNTMPQRKPKLMVSQIPIKKTSTQKKTLINIAKTSACRRNISNKSKEKAKYRNRIIEEHPKIGFHWGECDQQSSYLYRVKTSSPLICGSISSTATLTAGPTNQVVLN